MPSATPRMPQPSLAPPQALPAAAARLPQPGFVAPPANQRTPTVASTTLISARRHTDGPYSWICEETRMLALELKFNGDFTLKRFNPATKQQDSVPLLLRPDHPTTPDK